ncbi:MAG: hypothetical protein ACUVWP_05885 [bacterium]
MTVSIIFADSGYAQILKGYNPTPVGYIEHPDISMISENVDIIIGIPTDNSVSTCYVETRFLFRNYGKEQNVIMFYPPPEIGAG